MNLKPARMNVRWKGVDTELRNIDDPVTGPRLKEILDAHELLWGVWLIGAAHLTPDQKALAVEEFELRFLVRDTAQLQRRLKHAEALIEVRLAKEGGRYSGDVPALLQRRRQVAEEYLATSTDKQSHARRLSAAAKRVISDHDRSA